MRLRRSLLPILGTAIALIAFDESEAITRTKKLIEFGWDEPDPAFMRRHVAQMERTPFDGCVFHLNYKRKDGGEGNFTWDCWGKRAFTMAELKPALDDLKATRFRRFKHNFLRFNVTPADVDWFDNYSAVLTNARLAARIARDGRCKGIAFDIEQYKQPLFDYHKQKHAGTRSWAEYSAQARRRGRQVMQAFQAGYPGVEVFFTFGYSIIWNEANEAGKKRLEDCQYGLLAPFLDGMVETTLSPARLIDGFELSYSYRDTSYFDLSYRTVKHDLRSIVGPKRKYDRVFSCAFGIWMDYDWRENGWNTESIHQNFYDPTAFEASVRQAMRVSDEYVWIYTETPRWWSGGGKPVKLPQEYDAALRRARRTFRRD